LVLKAVGTNLVDESDTPSFLVQIKENALTILFDATEGSVELRTTITALRMKDLACDTLRVDTDEDGIAWLDVA
jgi:hypothetical protein